MIEALIRIFTSRIAFTTFVCPIETQLRKVVPELCVDDVPESVAEVEMSSSCHHRCCRRRNLRFRVGTRHNVISGTHSTASRHADDPGLRSVEGRRCNRRHRFSKTLFGEVCVCVWIRVFWSIEELKCFKQCTGVNVKTGGVFREPRRMVNLSSSCLGLVALWSADKRLFSAVVLVRVGRALLFFSFVCACTFSATDPTAPWLK